MKRAFTMIEGMILVALLCLIAAVAIPAFSPKKQAEPPAAAFGMGEVTKASKRIVEDVDYQNAAGQYVAILGKIDTLGPWLASHHDCEIISMTAVSVEDESQRSSNPTTNIVIVYRRLSK